MSLATAVEIVAFWREAGPEKWFVKDEAFDAEIRIRFLAAHEAAAAGQLRDWEATPEGVYALLILLDQFPRNLFRGSPQAFATDAQALGVAERAIAHSFDRAFDNPERRFIYMPFMHAEDLAHQERCVALCQAADDPEGVEYAAVHRDIIRDFGRFPHRNPVLGRDTTAEERAFLAEGGFSG
ncbi:DUF924 domain-containing protein [Bosea caraganae]|uniref:DUF924 domain-containing protein n=1 Tax=Bosea caraganae TaxID=2763117 RepID=A0A370LB04_9HYPH|nr:DUF924 family protein [Bosea caraganae]RDJ27146.1 DUF924 domain-containing protein [Bosea caraganae]RDJ29163.1 DUF924 domain-containing protein [Bosea caraganae]